tara:strand:+ start:102 stop:728 length:627 start_codon:yes stop_codon:yes gene_type:complete
MDRLIAQIRERLADPGKELHHSMVVDHPVVRDYLCAHWGICEREYEMRITCNRRITQLQMHSVKYVDGWIKGLPKATVDSFAINCVQWVLDWLAPRRESQMHDELCRVVDLKWQYARGEIKYELLREANSKASKLSPDIAAGSFFSHRQIVVGMLGSNFVSNAKTIQACAKNPRLSGEMPASEIVEKQRQCLVNLCAKYATGKDIQKE